MSIERRRPEKGASHLFIAVAPKEHPHPLPSPYWVHWLQHYPKCAMWALESCRCNSMLFLSNLGKRCRKPKLGPFFFWKKSILVYGEFRSMWWYATSTIRFITLFWGAEVDYIAERSQSKREKRVAATKPTLKFPPFLVSSLCDISACCCICQLLSKIKKWDLACSTELRKWRHKEESLPKKARVSSGVTLTTSLFPFLLPRSKVQGALRASCPPPMKNWTTPHEKIGPSFFFHSFSVPEVQRKFLALEGAHGDHTLASIRILYEQHVL